MPIRLIPASSGEPIKLDKPVLLLGRNPDCDVVLTNSRKVSRNHCLIATVDDKLFIRDLGSTNGVWINGHRVEREARIRPGDEVSIADLKYSVRQVERNGAAKPEKSAGKRSTGDEHDAGGRHVRKVGVAAPGSDQPVVIPDEDESFVVEASEPRLPRAQREQLRAAAEQVEANRDPEPDAASRSPSRSRDLELAEPLNLDEPIELDEIGALHAEPDVDGGSTGVVEAHNAEDSDNNDGDSDAWLPLVDDDDLPIVPFSD
ncbi:MAG: FHA domain-containing protein [Planctomycetota bacterium]|jgi:predicted component of type VI protein secretion system